MKAIRVEKQGGPEVLKLVDIAPIEAPGPGQAPFACAAHRRAWLEKESLISTTAERTRNALFHSEDSPETGASRVFCTHRQAESVITFRC